MLLRIDRLQVELPQPPKADARSTASLQELPGGKFGKMPGLNDVFQRCNFHNKGKPRLFRSRVAGIIAMKSGPVEVRTQPPIQRHNARMLQSPPAESSGEQTPATTATTIAPHILGLGVVPGAVNPARAMAPRREPITPPP
jgi:hypothetical protein